MYEASDPIYTVTTVRHALGAGSRTVGFFHKFEDAEKCLKENHGDINEMGYYPYAVIEKTYPGIYTAPRAEFWYQWNHEKGEYDFLINKPERFKIVAGWGMG